MNGLCPSVVADGDPHFVVEFPLSKLTVCFNINGEPGHVLRLVSDHKHSGTPRDAVQNTQKLLLYISGLNAQSFFLGTLV